MTMRNRVKELVDGREMTVYQFWQMTGISRTTAYALYNKPEQYPGRDVMDAICRVLKVQPGDVLEWVDSEQVPNASTPIDELSLPVKPYNRLQRAGIKTIGELRSQTRKSLAESGLDRRDIESVCDSLEEKYGVSLPQLEE